MNKVGKAPLIILIVSLIFLTLCMFYVVHNSKTRKLLNNEDIKDMTIQYIDKNFDIDLYDEETDEGVKLLLTADYIGSDVIKEQPVINMNVSCYYVYKDAGNTYTDMKNENINIVYEDEKYKGESTIDFGRSDLENYSCTFKVAETSGKYAE